MKKHKFLNILFVLSAVFSYSQVTLLAINEDKDLKINEKFTVTFVLEISGNEYIQETPLRLPDFSKFNTIGSGSDRNTIVDPEKNIVINQIVYQMVLQPKQTGKLKIGSALVQVNGKMYKTEPFDIFVSDSDKKSPEDLAVNDVYLNMEIKEKEVYANQPTIAVLRAYSRNYSNFRKLENIVLPKQNEVSFQTVSYRKSDIEPFYRGSDLASQIIAVYMIFPNQPGNVEVEPITAFGRDENVKILSNKVNLNVRKLPDGSPKNFKNAVGKYELSIEKILSDEPEKIEKPISVVVKISGEGNLSNLALPKLLQSENYRLYPPKITNKIEPGENGMKGEISEEYVVVPVKSGEISISTENFSYFNPADEEYVNIGRKSLKINVLNEELIGSKSTLEKVNEYTKNVLEKVNVPLKTQDFKVVTKKGLNWNLIFSGIVAVIIILVIIILVKKRQKTKETRQKTFANLEKPIENISETEKKLRAKNQTSLKDDLHYLKYLAGENNREKFFEVYDELIKQIENQLVKNNYSDIKTYLEQNFGSEKSEAYTRISEKITAEKYAPLSDSGSLRELYGEIEKGFDEVSI